MKTNFLFSVASIMMLLTSCIKTEHKIRVQNLYNQDFYNLKIGADNFGTVTSGATSDYQSIPEGSGAITGNTNSNIQIIGGGYAIEGKGKHLWTAIISASGGLSIKKDK